MKIIFGGTFDPLHNGHLDLALQISQQFQHNVSLMPTAGVPNYKSSPIATIEQRLAMLQEIVQIYPTQLSIELVEANLPNYSPTVFTLRKLRELYGYDEEFYFVIGGDSLISLDKYWDEWQSLFNLTNFIVAMRPEYELSDMSEQLGKEVLPRMIDINQTQKPFGEIITIDFTPHPISSTMIRREIALDHNITNFIPTVINNYITINQLYKGK